MPTIAHDALDWLDRHPRASCSEKTLLLTQVPSHQWADPDGHWAELSEHCCNRVEHVQAPRFMNRLSINVMTPLPRCLYRSPDGRDLAYFKSGGEVEAYGRCEQAHCEHAKEPNTCAPIQ